MKVLVIGGMHGNEPLGIGLVANLRAWPIPGVDALLANEVAIAEQVRYCRYDLNRSFPGKADVANYEQRRPVELLAACEGYDLVLDFHNTYCPGNDCVFVGEAANELLYRVARAIGLPRVIVADYDCINKYASNCLSVEISLSSRRNSVAYWRRVVKRLSSTVELPAPVGLETYRFAYRMTLEDQAVYCLDKQNLQAFQPIDPQLAKQLGVPAPAYPIFVADAYTPYNYGGLVTRFE